MEYLHARKDTAVGILVGNGIDENRQGASDQKDFLLKVCTAHSVKQLAKGIVM